MVPLVDLRLQHEHIEAELDEVFQRVLHDSSFILGKEVATFEEAFAAYLGTSHAIAVSSGTAALQLALLALDVGSGDEVITVPNTFIATAEAVSAVGARPVFVDVDPASYTMDPAAVERAITGRTKALLPVHLYGQPADLDPLALVAQEHNLFLIEDACQAHGAEYKAKRAGTLGAAGCFSFYPSKNLGCLGEGGALVTNDANVAKRVRMFRDHGSVRKYEHSFPGYNFRLEGLQGGMLSVKLKYLDAWNDRRRSCAKRYNDLFAGSSIQVPREMPYARHVYHLYVIQADNREAVRQQLATRGVDSGLHYPIPLHLQTAYSHLGYKRGDFPVCESTADRVLSLPMHPELTDEQVDFVASAVLESLKCPAMEQAAAS